MRDFASWCPITVLSTETAISAGVHTPMPAMTRSWNTYTPARTSVTPVKSRPKLTVGVTPITGITPYVTYAEGYRAPALTETIIAGAHVTGGPGGAPPFFLCPDGNVGFFCFLPNPNLRPEVGKTKEAGVNLKFGDIFAARSTSSATTSTTTSN